MDTQPVPSDNGGGPPTLAQPGIVRVVCLTCAYTWTGAPAEQPAGCPHDGRELVVTAATGETIEQAIAAAVQEMPERVEPRQQTLPGTRPAFDSAAALDLIEQAAEAARDAELAYASSAETTKARRKIADGLNEKLRTLIRDLAERRHDARYEPQETDAEEAATDDGVDVAVVDGGQLDALEGDASGDQLVSGEPAAEPAEGARADRPGEVAPTYEELAEDASNAATLALLHRAGADQITLDAVDAWTEAQYTAARAWALEQIEAHANDAHGKQTSVLWPAHVSLAQHGPPTHTPKKRTKKKTTRRRAR
jgi:hypothetical protein